MPPSPVITFTSDFGSREPYVGAVKGAILSACPGGQIVDLTHEIGPHDLLEASYVVANAYACFPTRTVHLVIVDPTVGSGRRAIIASNETHFFVAPDNGVLSLVFAKDPPTIVVSIEADHYFRKPVSPTFHGRDIFGPVVGWLAKGTDIEHFGPVIRDYVRFTVPAPKLVANNRIEGMILHVDRFGNVITNISPEEVRSLTGRDFQPMVFRLGEKEVKAHRAFYSQSKAEELFSVVGSNGYYELAALGKPAARLLEARRGAKIELEIQ